MPRKNSIKEYVQDGIYHIYNRGVEKRIIFQDSQDYKVFLTYLNFALSPPPDREDILKTFTLQGLPFKGVPRLPKNFHQDIQLLAYCLMPNHFHLLIQQKNRNSIKSFMNSIMTRYSMYFNKKYKRVGSLFQGPYKAVLVDKDVYLLHLSRYLHLNPSKLNINLVEAYSSYADYLKLRKTNWVNTKLILNYFNNLTIPEIKKFNNYKKFVEEYTENSENILGNLIIEG